MVSHPTREEFDGILEHMLGQRIVGRPKQAPYTATLAKNYKVGSRLQTPDGLVWHYGQAGVAGMPTIGYGDRGAVSMVLPTGGGAHAIVGTAVAGATQVVIDDNAVLADRPEDYYENGFVSIHAAAPAWTHEQRRKVKGSSAGNGTSITLTLYQPLTINVPDASTLEISRSPYYELDNPEGLAHISFMPHVGFSFALVLPHYYCWFLTWGFCRPDFSGDVGHVGGVREAFFATDGSVTCENGVSWIAGAQHAGYIVGDTHGAPNGLTMMPHLMLQLDP